jgi:hypothetical protein
VSAQLPNRFQEAIDQAAMATGMINSDDYTDSFRWGEAEERDGTAQEVAAAVVAELDAQYTTINWRATVDQIQASR